MKTTLGDSHESWIEENKDKSTFHQEENKDKNSTEDASNDKDYLLSEVNYEGFAFVQDQVMLYINYINAKAGVPNSWILLDSQSIVDLFPNKNLLKNICLMSSDITQEKSLFYSRFNDDVATELVTTTAEDILRTNFWSLKGKMTWHTHEKIEI